ncbi:4-carboxy-4-hydroxy-2-oxoadipate aldolase/oxaloacetate decarboxylase [Halomonas sp. 1513]|nr:4-carboxy-4-hydroxy-2-oxoadipate aldolase/oxaloacetate decarboxylase [Halomonas sp. 1513]APX91652.1 4-carboxy-4-hydroxy-2-oxoadipate aldolase/oxaloacetate decarboxylase [Halomonas sp. 1513]
MNKVAIKTIERAEKGVIEALGKCGVATVHEAQGRSGAMEPEIRAGVPGAAMAGSAVTVLCAPGDNWMLHVAIELMEPGDVLVVGTTSRSLDGFFGDILAEFVTQRGGVGAVLDTGARDIKDLREQGFPVWSRAISPQGTVKETVGAVNVPIMCGGRLVIPGDVVVADDDGVVLVPRQRAASVLDASHQRIEKEEAMRTAIKQGGKTLDLLGLREKVIEKGLRYDDGPLDWPLYRE